MNIHINERDTNMPFMFEAMHGLGPVIAVVGTLFWIWMLIDCMSRARVRSQRGWLILLLFFTGWVGALIYFFINVFPAITRWFGNSQGPMQQPMQRQTPVTHVYYTPPTPTPQSYPEYQHGYQPQPQHVSSPTPLNANLPYQQGSSQQSYPLPSTQDYDEPYATYPEMPPQQQ